MGEGMSLWMQRAAALALVGTLGLGCGEEGGEGTGPTAPSLTVEFRAPVEGAATRQELGIALEVRGEAPDRVDLYVDGGWLATLEAASYRWDTRDWPEGEHVLTARVQRGGQVFTSAERKVVVDRSPPRVVARSPAPGANAVEVNDAIQLTLSEPLTLASLSTLRLELEVPLRGVVSLNPTLSADRKTLSFAHRPDLEPAYSLSATLRGEMEDDLGNRGAVAVESWSWSVPAFFELGVLLNGLSTHALPVVGAPQPPVLRIDAQGAPVFAWRYGEKNVLVRRWEAPRWETLVDAEIPPAAGGTPVGFTLNAEGLPTAASFAKSPGSVPLLMLSQWAAGHWLEPRPVLLPSGLTGVGPVFMEYSPANHLRVAWTEDRALASDARGVMFHGEVPQREPSFFYERLSTRTPVVEPSLAMTTNARGNALVAWNERGDDGVYRTAVLLHRLLAPSVPLPEPISYVSAPALALGANDEPFMAWANPGNIQVRQWNGSAWVALGSGVAVPSGSGSVAYGFVMGLVEGRPLIVSKAPGAVIAAHWNGSVWKPVSMPRPENRIDFGLPLLQKAPSGAVYVGWMENTASSSTPTPRLFRLNR